ncbi:hypothetical protein [Leptospira vanthielii]|nr:hypothetical protein [Leptospira vanthielii]
MLLFSLIRVLMVLERWLKYLRFGNLSLLFYLVGVIVYDHWN